MAYEEHKMTVLMIFLCNIVQFTYSHEDTVNYLAMTDSSDDMETEPVRRSDMIDKSKSYKGLPIDLSPSRQTTKSATTAVYPPLSRRFRRIYNPDETASVSDYPFMAALLVNGQLWCGAAIIRTDSILTAAHCLQLQYNNRFFREYVKMLTVRVGSSNATSGGEIYRVTEIFFHPNYKPSTLEFNFAVVKLHKNISAESEYKASVIEYSQDRLVPTDTQITFLGWGSVLGSEGLGGQTLLQKVKLPVYDFADCQEVYGKDLVTRSNFCAGYITLPKNVCNPDQPAVFSSVGFVAEWLGKLGEKRMRLR
ncbi:unnamed protein product [Parnassius mnemosyne]|uniref:Peptidase S1 domain-containing protein n=1 Tax=Parnassius mnemosyne TaxID=213953 RepID=A0AAV1L803_9NEOP